MKNMQITKETNIAELTRRYPEAALVMLEYGLHCVGCAINQFDTIENGAQLHGMSETEIAEMLNRIKEAIGLDE